MSFGVRRIIKVKTKSVKTLPTTPGAIMSEMGLLILSALCYGIWNSELIHVNWFAMCLIFDERHSELN